MANLKQGIDNLVKEVTVEPKKQPYEAYMLNDDGDVDESKSKFFDTEDEAIDFANSNNYHGVTGYNYDDGGDEPNSSYEVWKREVKEPEMVYPKGTSKEYTDKVNAAYEKAMELLKSKGIDMSGYKSWDSEHGGMDSNMKEEFFDKYVFGPFREKYGKLPAFDSNKKWESEGYRELYDALDSFFDKQYNDWWINKHRGQ